MSTVCACLCMFFVHLLYTVGALVVLDIVRGVVVVVGVGSVFAVNVVAAVVVLSLLTVMSWCWWWYCCCRL